MSNSLKEINHIVVLMLENRSFDHMLGYLRKEAGRMDVDGLTGTEINEDPQGKPHSPQSLTDTIFAPDPHHEWAHVQAQLQSNNGGFIKDFASYVPPPPKPERIMYYHNAADLKTFDHLAKEFCVCDRWFSSVPGATQPNRIYSLAGHCNGRKDNLPNKQVPGGWDVKAIFKFLPKGVSWRYYSHDIASLRFVKDYLLNLKEIDKVDSFYDRARKGKLTNISWIDPDFDIGKPGYPGPPNDDHPPHDVRHGQNLVSKVYNALLNGPKAQWKKTLLIVVYDEHGGFYDHVSPEQWTPADDLADFRKYGVRVPAFAISPWVGRQVAYGSQQNVVFDHTSILKTILVRFCTRPDGSIPKMTARVDAAKDLGVLLTESKARTDCTAAPELIFEPSWKDRFILLESVEGTEKLLVERPPSELQESLEAVASEAIAKGVPPDKL